MRKPTHAAGRPGDDEMSYDPWSAYRAARQGRRANTKADLAPHESLLRLLQEARKEGWEVGGPCSPAVEALVAEWCARCGPLVPGGDGEHPPAILEAAEALEDALIGISGENQRDALQALREMIAPVSVYLGFDESGQLVQQWESPSLLAALGMMAVLDLTTGESPWIECAACGALFRSGRGPAQTICTDECRRARLTKQQAERRHQAKKQAEAQRGPWPKCAMCGSVFVAGTRDWQRFCTTECQKAYSLRANTKRRRLARALDKKQRRGAGS